jgi:DNA-binding MarR family transcriptional regulator
MTASTDERSVCSESEAARLSTALHRVARWIRRQQDIPLGQGAVSALATIAAEGPLRLGDLAARESVGPATLSRIIAVLEGEGYVERRHDPHDRRSWRVRTTAHGERLLADLRGRTASVVLERLDRLPPEQRASIVAALPALEAMGTEDVTLCAEPTDEILE